MVTLVTGGTGFVGANIVQALLEQGERVVAAHYESCDPAVVARLRGAGELELVWCDVRSTAAVGELVRRYRPGRIVHAAAITPSAELERSRPGLIVETNEVGTLQVLLAAARYGVERVVFVSSAAVYAPDAALRRVDEEGPLRSDPAAGLYALTKIASERLCAWASERLGIDTRVVRLGPVYGPFEQPTGARQGMSALYRAVALALAGEPIRCNGPEVAQDWVYGPDVAVAVAAVLAAKRPGARVYNVAGEEFLTLRATLATVAQLLPEARVEWVSTVEEANVPIVTGIARRGPLDSGRIRGELGWRPRALAAGLAGYLAWLGAER